MKQIRNKIVKALVCCLALLSGLSCSKDAELPGGSVASDGNSIILNISSASVPVTRAEASGVEVAVEHLDVLIFDANEAAVYSERVSVNSGSSSIILSAKKSDFSQGDEFYVYLIANSTHSDEEFAALATVDALRSMTQTDENIHMTGLGVTGAPTSFLMDGVAYSSGNSDPGYASTVVLNDGSTGNTELAVTLRRAAAKVVVTISQGSSVTFDRSLGTPGYYVSNMPYSTSVIAGVNGEADLRTPDQASTSDYFSWNSSADTITVTAYMYAHSWTNESAYENEVRLVVNIPMVDLNDTNEETQNHASNYYQVPISEQKVLNRNTCYLVTATVNALGSSSAPTPVLLDSITYSVLDWDVTTIDIGGSTETAAYLTLNEYEMELHNMTDDETTLHFVSSSDVTVEVTDVYYYNKYNVETHLTQSATDATQWSSSDGTSCTITTTPDEGITGYLHVHSDLPDNNAVRYIVLTVTNSDGISRQVVIAQYPLEYITNIQSWYSYRTDFVTEGYGLTTYELFAGYDASYVLSYSSTAELVENNSWISGCTWTGTATAEGEWSYGPQENGFFGSKLASQLSDGTADVYLYHWSRNTSTSGGGPQASTTYSYSRDTQQGEGTGNLNNARMYHVQLTATSDEYTLGRPRMTTVTFSDGVVEERTDSGLDNAELVSPSFIIASELGGTNGGTLGYSVNMAASHCARYAEVFTNAAGETIHFTDWRLPTTSEIAIILKFQDTSDAMDNVLPGPQYWAASGQQVAGEGSANPGVVLTRNEETAAVRCVRDAYEDESIFAQ